MNSPDAENDPVTERLFREPFAFDFFQAVRLLELLHDRSTPTEVVPTEVVRFSVPDTDAFPASQIVDLKPAQADTPAILKVNFFGLTGPSGVLPQHYTHLLLAQTRAADNPERRAASAWFDLFNHRMISLFYRAWTKYRLPIAFERESRENRRDPITRAVLCLLGLGTPGLRDRITVAHDSAEPTESVEPKAIDDLALVRYAGLFAHTVRSAAGLVRLLSDYFAIPVQVEQFRGYWVPLDAGNQTRLGRSGQNQVLGESVVVGKRYWDAQGRFQVKLGPMGLAEFERWLPDREAGQCRIMLLVELTRFYIRDGLDFDIRLILRETEIPTLQLTRTRHGPRLGWNTWLGQRKSHQPADDTVFCSLAITRRYGSRVSAESES